MEAGAIGLLANTDILNQLGLPLPQTYADFINCCEVLSQNNVAPVVVGFGTGGYTSGHIFAMARSLGKMDLEAIDYAALEIGGASIGELFRPGFELVDEFNQQGYWTVVDSHDSADWSEDMEIFTAGGAAFMATGSWQLQRVELAEPDFEYEFSALPLGDDDNVAVIRASTPICANAQGEHLDLALKFLEYISQKEHVEAFTRSQTALSPLKDGAKPVAILEQMDKVIQEGRVTTDSEPRFPVDLVTQHLILSQDIVSGSKTVEEAVAYLDSMVNAEK